MLNDGTAVTTDTLVEGVHFDDRLSPGDVGWKTVAASVSDLAAMGAQPDWAVLSLSLPSTDGDWVDGFAGGLGAACAHWSVQLIGGDTTGSPGPRVVGLTLAGRCVAAPLTRTGASPGDDLWVTGPVGLAGAGWSQPSPGPACLGALRRPEPPLAFALALARAELATSGMDLSDGLASDLPRLARASGCAIELHEDALPSHPELHALPPANARFCALAGGEDYALLFTSPPDQRGAILALAGEHDLLVSRIGAVRPGRGATTSGGPWPDGSFDHFSEAS